MKLLEIFRGKKAISIEDLEAALDAYKPEIVSIEKKISSSEARTGDVLLEQGPSALAKLEEEIAGHRKVLANLRLAESTTRRRLEAAKAEQQAVANEELIKRTRAEALAAREALDARTRGFHAHAVGLIADAEKIKVHDSDLARHNKTLTDLGRADLVIEAPWQAISEQLVRFAKEEGFAFPVSEAWQEVAKADGIDAVPASAWSGVPLGVDVPDVRKITIPHYLENGIVRWQQPFRFL